MVLISVKRQSSLQRSEQLIIHVMLPASSTQAALQCEKTRLTWIEHLTTCVHTSGPETSFSVYFNLKSHLIGLVAISGLFQLLASLGASFCFLSLFYLFSALSHTEIRFSGTSRDHSELLISFVQSCPRTDIHL